MTGCIIALVLALGGQAPQPSLRELAEAGLKAKQAGDLEAAIRAFEQVAALAPSLAAAHVNLGAVLLEARQYEKAAASLRRALALAPDLPGAHAMLGAALLTQGYASEAIPHLEKGQSWDLLGVALLESGRIADAIPVLEKAAAERPDDPDLLYYLGRAHSQLSRQLFDRLLEAHPDSARAHQLLGEAHQAGGNRELAEKELRAALERRNTLPGVHLALGELYESAGDYTRAEQEYRTELQARPGDARAAFKLGAVLLAQGRAEEALEWLERSDRLRPDMAETLFELARALTVARRLPEAEKRLRRVLELENMSRLAESASFQLSQILRRQHRTEEADRELERYRRLRASRLSTAQER